MAVLLTCHRLGKRFGAQELFSGFSLSLDEGERLGVIGPNGSGKSTLLRILAGIESADEGTVAIRKQTRLGYVPQDSTFPEGATVGTVIGGGLADLALPEEERAARVAVTLGRAGFTDPEASAASLSGGWKKRLAIAAEWVRQPDLLLLDEPTNHLDLEGVLWLERLLESATLACIVISHDRYFLENVATDVAEIARGYPDGMLQAKGGYSDFLEHRQAFFEAQARQQDSLASKVRREVEWLRRGPKARTGKSRARIQSAERLIGDLAEVTARNQTAVARIDFTGSDRRTKRLLAASGVTKSYAGRALFEGLNVVLGPGMRLGLVGANGSGKTTLLKLFAGELDPDAGTIERADALQVVSFTQHRETLAPELTLKRALAPEGDSVIYRGRAQHVAGWAKRFLFRAEQLEQPVGSLSGGERARVFIARLMLRPADLLLLDEPTNDLDIPTLEVLEESLVDFPGALVLVTHDRYLLDRVSNAVLALDGDGLWGMYAEYSQWEQAREQKKPSREPKAESAARTVANGQPRKKLGYLEQREWDGMEERILAAEERLAACEREMADPGVASDGVALQRHYAAAQEARAEVERLYARWAELEAKLG